ncbi:hypothetical protein E2C01_084468 [Portunus trituberculatus]|uniref:Uncharacterized protein n=1 Tax=Portunus trituberculatus TaxID=210409 RepID=A0A5B7J7L7_PORTR|nr:hypothetical protein [Portunus trituberculatus]
MYLRSPLKHTRINTPPTSTSPTTQRAPHHCQEQHITTTATTTARLTPQNPHSVEQDEVRVVRVDAPLPSTAYLAMAPTCADTPNFPPILPSFTHINVFLLPI